MDPESMAKSDPARIGVAGEMTAEQYTAARRAMRDLPGIPFPPSEWAASPEGLLEALKAQAVIARTFADQAEAAKEELAGLTRALKTVARAAGIARV